jgi:Transcription factor WhiB
MHAERTRGQSWQSAAMSAPELAGELPCQADPDLFFSKCRTDIKRAKRICLDCLALAACREWALTRAEWYGVWGGLSERERRLIYRYCMTRIGWLRLSVCDMVTPSTRYRTTTGLVPWPRTEVSSWWRCAIILASPGSWGHRSRAR